MPARSRYAFVPPLSLAATAGASHLNTTTSLRSQLHGRRLRLALLRHRRSLSFGIRTDDPVHSHPQQHKHDESPYHDHTKRLRTIMMTSSSPTPSSSSSSSSTSAADGNQTSTSIGTQPDNTTTSDTIQTPIASASTVNVDGYEYEDEEEEEEEEEEEGQVQGPSQAPTEAGVSTAGLTGFDAELIEACYKADVKAIESALDNGADVNTADVNGRTSLHFCAGNGLNLLVDDLASRGANIDKQDLLGYTALHIAAGYRMPSSVRALLALGADANIAAYDGKLPVEIAEELLEKTPRKRALFMENPNYTKLEEVVKLLDDATELEEEEEEEEEVDEEMEDGVMTEEGVREKTEKVGDTKFTVRVKPPAGSGSTQTSTLGAAGKGTGAALSVGDVEEKVEKVGDTTFTVRAKAPSEAGTGSSSNGTTSANGVDISNVDVKITVKEPGSSSSSSKK